jgi:hypothetical protein
MAIKLDSIKNNVTAEREGDYIEIPEWPGVTLGVRSLEMPAYKIALDILVQKYARKYKGKTAPPDVRDSDIGGLLADHVLFDWNGFDQAYTAEKAKELMTSPEGKEFVKQVLWAAQQIAESEVEFVADAVKNLPPPSVTN